MRSVGGLLPQMLARENLLRAAWRAAKGRRDQPAVRTFFAGLDEHLDQIAAELAAGEPRCGESRQFIIHDPKQRLITAPVFRERVLHHAVMDVCEPVLERRQTFHSYACRKGKGTHAAIKAAQQFARSSAWFLKCDIRSYFDSVPREGLLRRLDRLFRERKVKKIFHGLIHAYEPGRAAGLPIGSLVSQHLANFYLSELDTEILQTMRPAGFVRYMDDFVLWGEDRDALRCARDRIRDYAREALGLSLKDEPFINRSARGMDFLGYRVFPGRIALNRRSRKRFRRKLVLLDRRWRQGEMPEEEAQARGRALTAHAQHADCATWRTVIIKELGEASRATSGCCAAARGTTTAGTAARASATATSRATRTTTSASAPSQLQRAPSGPMDPKPLPAHPRDRG